MTTRTKQFRLMAALAVAGAIGLAACGSDGDGGGGSVDQGDMEAVAAAACDLTEPEVVVEAFGGTADGETEGTARNCTYALQGADASQIDVFHFGPASDWDTQRSSFDANDGPVTDVAGVGEEAFTPASGGSNAVVVRAGDVIFEVVAYPNDPAADLSAQVHDLANRIATDVG
jgi:hypothetical protein